MISPFLSGAIMMAAAAVAILLARFWRQTGDRLFLLFGAAFGLLAVERWVLVVVAAENELRPYVYLIRLGAFVLILAAVADKNRARNGD